MLREFEIDAKNSFIGGWFFSDATVCDGMLQLFDTCQVFAKAPGIVGSANGPVLNKRSKDSIELMVHVRMTDPRLQRYIQAFFDVIEMYKQKYTYAFTSAPWTIEEALNLQRYPPQGGFFNWHTERTCSAQQCVYRHLAFMTYLNDVHEGGETEFFYQQAKIRPRKGLSLIWPTDWTHTHRGIPAPKEEKTIVTGWIKFV